MNSECNGQYVVLQHVFCKEDFYTTIHRIRCMNNDSIYNFNDIVLNEKYFKRTRNLAFGIRLAKEIS
jgi:hypothetical protein